MSTITLKDMTYYYDNFFKNVFSNVNLNLDTDWKLGLVGRNGRGKTTLLRLLNKDLDPSKGKISMPVNTEYFPYNYKKSFTKTIDVVKENIAPYHQLEEDMDTLIKKGDPKSIDTYGEILSRYEKLDGYIIDSLLEKEFRLIGLKPELLNRDFKLLSGGEKNKALIVAMFLKKNHFLLIDEPTNHLDIEGRKKLSKYLATKKGYIVISHDRTFLDGCIDHVLSINKETIHIEKGNYSSWLNNKNLQDEYELNTRKKLERQVKVLEKAANKNRRWSFDKEKEKIGCKGDKGAIGARAARLMKRAINIERRTNNMLDEKKELLKDYETVKALNINQRQLEDDIYITTKKLSFSYDNKKLIDNLNLKLYKGDRLWIKGQNGCGKTTLLKILCGEIDITGGTLEVNPEMKISRGYQDVVWKQGFLNDLLKKNKINENKFKYILSFFDIGEEYFKRPIETFSQGEKKKIDIARAFSSENHIFIWDEPLNFMDILFRTQLEDAILKFEPTIIFVEHDESFGKKISNKILDM